MLSRTRTVAREELKISLQPSVKTKNRTPNVIPIRRERRKEPALPLTKLEALACALLAILLALFSARIAADQSLRLQLFTQFRVEQH